MSIQYLPINKTSGQEWNSDGTVYLLRVGSETANQAAARKTANNNLTVLTNLPSSIIIDNPNDTGGGSDMDALIAAAGSKPVYAGTIDTTNSYQSDIRYLNLAVNSVDVDGLITLQNNATESIPSNARYHINNTKFVSSLTGLKFEPFQGLHIVVLWPNLGTPDYTWLALGEPDYFKAYSLIHFN